MVNDEIFLYDGMTHYNPSFQKRKREDPCNNFAPFWKFELEYVTSSYMRTISHSLYTAH